MNGVKLGEGYVSESEGKENILGVISDIACQKVNEHGKRIKPDIIFATDVIMRTFSPRLLKGQKRDEYERAIDTLFAIRDSLSQVHTEIGLLWNIDDDNEKDE